MSTVTVPHLARAIRYAIGAAENCDERVIKHEWAAAHGVGAPGVRDVNRRVREQFVSRGLVAVRKAGKRAA